MAKFGQNFGFFIFLISADLPAEKKMIASFLGNYSAVF